MAKRPSTGPRQKQQLARPVADDAAEDHEVDVAGGLSDARDCSSGTCPFQQAIDLLSKKHALTIIWLLQKESPRRFNDIKRNLGINPVSLSQRLEELQQHGILARREFNEIPPRVEYSLTAKGKDLIPLMDQLDAWATKHDIVTA